MRTTVDIPESLLRRAKQIAIDTNRSLSEVVKDSLIAAVGRYQEPPNERFTLPVFKGGTGPHPGVDLSDNAALLDLMNEPEAKPGDLPKLR